MKNWLDKYEYGGQAGYTDIPFDYNSAWGGQFQDGGNLTFLEPTSPKLPSSYVIPYRTPSSELATSIGGEDGEPAFLIPTFKYGHPLENPDAEFRKTGEHLGGPFKTWQEADEWDMNVRHPYVEKGQSLPIPLRRWGKEFAMGGSLPGSVGFTYARTQGATPSNGPYAKKTKASAQDGKTIVQNLNLPKYEEPTGFLTGYGYGMSPQANVNIYGVGAYGEKKVSPRATLSGNMSSQSVTYPGGSEMFMKPRYDVGMRYRFDNGGSMSYYQHGLDWKPKTISRDGSIIPQAQDGKTFEELTGLKPITSLTKSGESTSLGTKIDEAALRQASIDSQRRKQGSIRQAEAPRSAASKALAIATHPITALAYKTKGQDIPENFERGERNPYDIAVDIVNPLSYIDQARQIKEDVGQGNYLAAGIGALGLVPGEGAFERGAGKFLHNKKGITLDDFESAINYHLGEGLGIKKNPSNLTVKVRPGNKYPGQDVVETEPKFTIDLYQDGKHSGYVGLDKLNTADYNIPGKKGTIYTKVADYPYAFSSAGEDAFKGSGISGELNKAMTNALQEYELGKLYSSTMHTDEGLARWKNLVNKKKAKEVAPNRFELYKKGGVIEDDRGQWAHPGKITEIQGNNMATHGYGDIPLYVVPDVGEPRVIEANTGNHTFPGATKFTEYPLNKKSKGWLDKYN